MAEPFEANEKRGIEGRKFAPIFIILALLLSLSAVYLNYHFTQDRGLLQERLQGENQQLIQTLRQRIAQLRLRANGATEINAKLDILSKRLDEAAAAFKEVLHANPRHAPALSQLALISLTQGKVKEGVRLLDQSLRVFPNQRAAWYNRGAAMLRLNRPAEAADDFAKAVALAPNFADAHSHRAMALNEIGAFEEAIVSAERALALNEANADTHLRRGVALLALGRAADAAQASGRALQLNPALAPAHQLRGHALGKLNQFDEALSSFDAAVACDPNSAPYHADRANMSTDMGRAADALENYERAIALAPDTDFVRGNYVHCRKTLCDWDGLDQHIRAMLKALDNGDVAASPFSLLACPSTPAQQLRAGRGYSAKIKESAPTQWRVRERGKIRLGYFSADFHAHATSHLIANLLELHDRQRFEVIGFSYGRRQDDSVRRRVEGACDHMVEASAMTDEEIVAQARALEINIAIDLKGYTQFARTNVFAAHAAPIQVSYLGYPGTMGARFIDYFIGDEIILPKEHQRFFTEKIVYLPNTYQPNDSARAPIASIPTRPELGLPENAFVRGKDEH